MNKILIVSLLMILVFVGGCVPNYDIPSVTYQKFCEDKGYLVGNM